MSSKIFVGGLAWETDDATLGNAFNEFGDIVEAKVIRDRETGRSRGFGFVTFEDSSAANDAIEAMNGQELDGRQLRVDLAQERPRRNNNRSGGGDRRGGGGGRGRW